MKFSLNFDVRLGCSVGMGRWLGGEYCLGIDLNSCILRWWNKAFQLGGHGDSKHRWDIVIYYLYIYLIINIHKCT